jgi:hypothetical protein
MLRKAGFGAFCGIGLALFSVGVAAADRCHTPLAGTRSLTLTADVTGYWFSGDRVLVGWRRGGCRGVAIWTGAAVLGAKPGGGACRSSASVLVARSVRRLGVSDAIRTVRIVPASALSDVADRLVVTRRAANRVTASFPLPTVVERVSVYRGYAVLSRVGRGELYVMRLSDGRIAQIGVTRAGDRPVIGSAGLVYQDDLDLAKHRNAPAQRTLRLVPLDSVLREVARPFTTVRKYMSYSSPTYAPKHVSRPAPTRRAAPVPASASGPLYFQADPPRPFLSARITAMAMDGARVALAVRDPRGRCDYVLFWNVEWHYVTRLTRAMGLTCPAVHAPGGIRNVAIAGSRAAWTVSYGRQTRVMAAVISNCAEWVVARTQGANRLPALTGDGGVLAYALPDGAASKAESSVGIVPSTWGGTPLASFGEATLALSADADRVAVLGSSGAVWVETRTGQEVARLQVGAATGIALRGDQLVVLSSGRIDVYSVAAARLIHSWPSPRGATSVDMHYGIVLVAAGRDVYALNVTSGRMVRVFRAPAAVRAQIEAPGAALQYNVGRRGYVRFIPMSALEASTR